MSKATIRQRKSSSRQVDVNRSTDAVTKPGSNHRSVLLIGTVVVLIVAALIIRWKAGDRDRSLESLKTDELAALAHLSPDDAVLHYHLASRLLRERRIAAASEEFATAVRLKPDDLRSRVGLGRTLLLLGKPAEAEQELREAVRIDANSSESHAVLAQTLLTQGKGNDAITEAKRAAELDSKNDQAWSGLATCYVQARKDDLAGDALQHALSIRPDSAQYHTELGSLRVRQGRFADALKSFDRALKVDPNFAEACALEGKLLLDNPPGPDSARRAEELLLKATTGAPRRPSEAWYDLGRLYLQTGRPAQAADALKNALKIEPRDERFFYSLARALTQSGDKPGAAAAESQFKRISALHSKMDALQAQLSHPPAPPATRLALARTYRELGLTPQAIKQYTLYLQSTPTDRAARGELDILSSALPTPAAAGGR